MRTELLLSEISAISQKYNLINQKTGGYFNVFDIANIASDEVTICRVLYELLNPRGNHYQGANYLKLFVENILRIHDFDFKSATVYREYVIDQNRRIDLVIQNEKHFIPIEVKIHAGEQERQCYDYYKMAKNSNVYYLTLFGTPPSLYSAKGLTLIEAENFREVTPISFEKDILNWLYSCASQRETLIIAPIREILLQLIAVVRKLTGQLEEATEMEIKELLMKSGENMRNAFAIESSLKECKISLMYKLFSTLENELAQKGMNKVNIYDYDGDKIKNFYERKGSTFPGISYLYKENIKPDLDIIFRIEIDERLFCGFCIAYKKESGKQRLSADQIKTLIPHIEPLIDDWWAYWEYIPNNSKNSAPNFKYPDPQNSYFQLYDEAYFNAFIADCVIRITTLFR